MAKGMTKIAQGAARSEGVTWFSQLRDKRKLYNYSMVLCNLHLTIYTGKGTKTHLYWCMRNCDGSPDNLRASIMNISKHYQVYR